MKRTLVLSLFGAVAVAHADLGVVPNAYANTGGTGVFLYMVTTARTYQYVINQNQLTSFIGTNLNGLSWRLPNSATAAWPPANASFANFDIFIGPGVAPSSISSAGTANNYTGTPVQVRSGSLTFPTGSFTSGGSPVNSFGPMVSFSDYFYTGGHLTVELRHSGMTGTTTTRSFDALTTSTSGYGTDFASRWVGNGAGTGSLTNANFFVTQFSSSAPVPEPASLIALGMGGVVLLRRARAKKKG
jgi:hypothetical protein